LGHFGPKLGRNGPGGGGNSLVVGGIRGSTQKKRFEGNLPSLILEEGLTLNYV